VLVNDAFTSSFQHCRNTGLSLEHSDLQTATYDAVFSNKEGWREENCKSDNFSLVHTNLLLGSVILIEFS
jgi:hypothetical protein